MGKLRPSGNTEQKVAELRQLAGLTAEAALTAAPESRVTVFDAAERLDRFADGLERRAKEALTAPAVFELPSNATSEEVQHARRRQATRRGPDVYPRAKHFSAACAKAAHESTCTSSSIEIS